MKASRFSMILVIIALSCALSACDSSGHTAKAITAIRSAKTAVEEKEAFDVVFRETKGYGIRFYDAAGLPLSTGWKYPDVKSITITWPNGQTVTTKIIDSSNLFMLMRE